MAQRLRKYKTKNGCFTLLSIIEGWKADFCINKREFHMIPLLHRPENILLFYCHYIIVNIATVYPLKHRCNMSTTGMSKTTDTFMNCQYSRTIRCLYMFSVSKLYAQYFVYILLNLKKSLHSRNFKVF